MNYPPPPPPPPPSQPQSSSGIGTRTGLAIASLALGILAFLLSFFVVGILFALIGLVLGLVHIVTKRGPAAMAWWGIGLALVAVVISVGMGSLYLKGFRKIKQTIASFQNAVVTAAAQEWEGVAAPDFSVITPDGKTVRLSELKGKRVVLNFWSTWWQPCIEELPQLIKLRNETSSDELVIIGISSEDPETLGAFAKTKGINYMVASGTNLPAPFNDIKEFPTTFFIDRNGVLQSIVSGHEPYNDFKAKAVATDFSGRPATAPGTSTLIENEEQLVAALSWSNTIPGGQALCVGDWDGDGQPDVLVAGGSKLHVLGADGIEKSVITLPGQFAAIECGRHQQKGPRLLGYSNWGHKVSVFDRTGKLAWTYASAMGVNGAHWGDLDGDGTDELIVGMNGFGGLHAVDANGKLLWKASLANVWGQAVIPAGRERGALVLATEAGGTVRVYDAKGNLLRNFQPNRAYCTQLAASCMETNPSSSRLQGIALAQTGVAAFDTSGAVLWSSRVSGGTPTTGSQLFACGDVDGDGVREWAFWNPAGRVEIVTVDGKTLATVTNVAQGHLAMVPDKDGRGLLVTLSGGTVKAYSFRAQQQ